MQLWFGISGQKSDCKVTVSLQAHASASLGFASCLSILIFLSLQYADVLYHHWALHCKSVSRNVTEMSGVTSCFTDCKVTEAPARRGEKRALSNRFAPSIVMVSHCFAFDLNACYQCPDSRLWVELLDVMCVQIKGFGLIKLFML